LLGVVSGKTDAGAVASDVFASLVSQGKLKDTDVTVIAKSDPIPNSPVAVRKDLSDSDTAILKSALLNLKDADALKAINTAGFIDNSDSNYNTLRDVAKILNLDLTKLK
jgi:phosphonate transport system substrate-binding protein